METVLNTSADNAWKVIGDFNGLTKFIPAITGSTLKGSGVGAERTLSFADGSKMVERLESLERNTLTYSIVTSQLPLEGYLACMRTEDLGNNRCKVVWSSSFTPKGVSEAEAVGIIRGVYTVGLAGLKKLFGD
jgi:hypothetical protein